MGRHRCLLPYLPILCQLVIISCKYTVFRATEQLGRTIFWWTSGCMKICARCRACSLCRHQKVVRKLEKVGRKSSNSIHSRKTLPNDGHTSWTGTIRRLLGPYTGTPIHSVHRSQCGRSEGKPEKSLSPEDLPRLASGALHLL